MAPLLPPVVKTRPVKKEPVLRHNRRAERSESLTGDHDLTVGKTFSRTSIGGGGDGGEGEGSTGFLEWWNDYFE